MASHYRDLTLTKIPGGTLVVSCDSCGGVGEKPNDVLTSPSYIVGRFTARVSLMEQICFGCEILSVVDALSCEKDPIGKEIIRGFKDEMQLAGLDPSLLTGSTEENFPTTMTAVGSVVVGLIPGDFSKPQIFPQDYILCVGMPLLGGELLEPNAESLCVTYKEIQSFKQMDGVREIVPVGSKGIAFEVMELKKIHHLDVSFLPSHLDLERSGGPATSVIMAVDQTVVETLCQNPKVTLIGQFT